MSNIDKYLQSLFDEVLMHWRATSLAEPAKNPQFPDDFYDVVMGLWSTKILTDPQLTMGLLNFFYVYKKYYNQDVSKFGCQYKVNEKKASIEITNILDALSEHLK